MDRDEEDAGDPEVASVKWPVFPKAEETPRRSRIGAGFVIMVALGAGQLTDAVEEGLLGMRGGFVKRIVAPPELVKRTMYPDNVSPDSSLVIKLVVERVIKGGR